MNNEQNKPTELTEKELEGIAGGAGKIAEILANVVVIDVKKECESLLQSTHEDYIRS